MDEAAVASCAMPASRDDWRRMGQGRVLPPGTTLVRERFRARSATDEHAHCLLCFAKFMDPAYSESHRVFVEEHTDVLTEGYRTTTAHGGGARQHWVCPPCADDFAREFGWHLAIG